MKKHEKKGRPGGAAAKTGKKPSNASFNIGFLGSDNFYYSLLALFIAVIAIVRWRLVGMPLERDEGEYAYMGQLILKGIPPYTEAYNMKLPGIYYMYSLIMLIFGETYRGIHIGVLVMNSGTMVFLFLAMKKLFNPMIAVLTSGIYGLMSMSYNFLAFAGHATHFAVFYVALGLFFFSKYGTNKNIIFALLTGAMFGMAFLMKQQAVYFILFAGITFLVYEFLDKPIQISKILLNTFLFSIGVFIPYILVVLVMAASGAFDKFWFWTVQYASTYVSGVPWSEGKELLAMTFTPIWHEFQWIWMLAIAGVIIVAFTKFSIKQKIMTLLFVLFSMLTTTPGFFFRQHYFIVLLPATALLTAITLEYTGKFIAKQFKATVIGLLFPIAILFILFLHVTSASKFFYSTDNPVALCKMIYGTNPFVESLEIAKYIKANSNEKDKIAVLGSEPQIPFYADRQSATGYIYTYGLMEIQQYNLKMQEEMIKEIEKSKPLFLVFCNIPFSWLVKPNSPKQIFEWYSKYSQENYNIVGLVDIPDHGSGSFYWGTDARRNPQYKNNVWIFKRKDSVVAGQEENNK